MSNQFKTDGGRDIERRLAEGRGQGRGADYKPWIMIHEFPSQGRAHREISPLNGRVCHLMSDLEDDAFVAVYALPGLRDTREQYPLEPEETLGIAERLGIAHPTDPVSHELNVVTTDNLLTFHDGLREFDIAVAIKPSAHLSSRRTLEKLEIERVYWSARNIEWRLLTERELPRSLVKNMRWLLPHLNLTESSDFPGEVVSRIRTVMEPAVTEGRRPLAEIVAECDDRLGLAAGSALSVTRHLIGICVWPVDLTVEIDPQRPLGLIQNGESNELARVFAA